MEGLEGRVREMEISRATATKGTNPPPVEQIATSRCGANAQAVAVIVGPSLSAYSHALTLSKDLSQTLLIYESSYDKVDTRGLLPVPRTPS